MLTVAVPSCLLYRSAFIFFSHYKLNCLALSRISLSSLIMDLNMSLLYRVWTCAGLSVLRLIIMLLNRSILLLLFCNPSLLFFLFKQILSLFYAFNSWIIIYNIFLNSMICATNLDITLICIGFTIIYKFNMLKLMPFSLVFFL